MSLLQASAPRWPEVSDELNQFGFSVWQRKLDPEQCKNLIDNYDHGQFRSTVVMARHGFGSGE